MMRPVIFAALFALPWIGFSAGIALAQAASDKPLTKAQIQALANNPNARAALAVCKDDRARLCGSVMPGGGRILRCFSEKAGSLSQPCRDAIIAVRNSAAN
ncbi:MULTISPECIES: cysteine rich repeat-containing protein [unclassified Hyphomicrobium]|uniref:cysteine rich repeat-containing protein n=1 Tax=unclassified Hyphomicrobium TaxID=2619925 RepID=UPI00045EAA4D|nr:MULTISPECIES: cysteine rich repeat-containing protein [unclassified Hyphomicrobium]